MVEELFEMVDDLIEQESKTNKSKAVITKIFELKSC